jgi:hypothetical protein
MSKKITELAVATALTGAEAFPLVQGGATKQAPASAVLVAGAYRLSEFGTIVRDGTGDNTAAVNAALAAMYAASRPGAMLDWGHGVIKCTGQIVFPNGNVQATGAPTQPTMVWSGRGGYNSGQETAPEGGTRILLTYQGSSGYNDAKVITRGLGLLVLEDLIFQDTTTGSSTPFFFTTNTTVKARRCAVIGGSSGSSCQQDAFVFGGTKKPLTAGYGDADSAFQGYGSSVKECYFDKIRRGVYGRSYANAVVVADNLFDTGCGTNLSGGAQVEFDGSLAAVESGSALGDYCTADIIRGNCFTGGTTFTYRVKLKKASGCVVRDNSSFDAGGSYVALCRLEHHTGATDSVMYPSLLNKISDNFSTNGAVLSQDTESAASGWNTLVGGGQSEGHDLAGNVKLGGLNPVVIRSAVFTGPSGANIIQATLAGESAFTARLAVLRSAAEGTNPGTMILELFNNGTLWLGGAGAGNISWFDEAGGALGGFSNNGKTWSAAGTGGGMIIDSGSGGSNVDVKAFALRMINFSTAGVVHTFTVNGVGLNGNAAVAKASAIASPTSDTVGTKAAIDAIRVAIQAIGITA